MVKDIVSYLVQHGHIHIVPEAMSKNYYLLLSMYKQRNVYLNLLLVKKLHYTIYLDSFGCFPNRVMSSVHDKTMAKAARCLFNSIPSLVS